MKSLKLFFISMMFLSINFIGCAQQNKNTMSVEELKSKMKADSNLVVLDVRTSEELEGPLGHIEGIVHIPIHQLEERLDEMEKYKEKEIAVICRTGNRSNKGAEILNEHGFNAKNVLGGMTEYRKKTTE